MELAILADADAAARHCAQRIAALLAEALGARGEAHLALNGGSTPRPVYEQLPALLEDWSGVHLWWGDERCVAPDSDESNYSIAAQTLIPGARIPDARVHRMRGELGAEEAARAYAAELAEHLECDDDGMPVLDVVHLGLGPDGHTASLFPGHSSLRVSGWATIAEHGSPKPPPDRLSLSLACLNAARHRLVHAVGGEKAQAAARIRGERDPQWPASLLERDALELILDEAAGADLRAR
jgi:6-phosphogluconolactonase